MKAKTKISLLEENIDYLKSGMNAGMRHQRADNE